MTFRRFPTTNYNGSSGPSGRAANGYTVTIWRRKEAGILGSFNAATLPDAMRIVRLLCMRYPSRLAGISRNQFGPGWIIPIYRPIAVAPDYRAFSAFSNYQRVGRRWVPRDNPRSWPLLKAVA